LKEGKRKKLCGLNMGGRNNKVGESRRSQEEKGRKSEKNSGNFRFSSISRDKVNKKSAQWGEEDQRGKKPSRVAKFGFV